MNVVQLYEGIQRRQKVTMSGAIDIEEKGGERMRVCVSENKNINTACVAWSFFPWVIFLKQLKFLIHPTCFVRLFRTLFGSAEIHCSQQRKCTCIWPRCRFLFSVVSRWSDLSSFDDVVN